MAKKNGKWKWIGAIILVLAAIIYYQTGQAPEKSPSPGPHYNLEKTGAGVVLNFSVAASQIHAAVDNGLKSVNLMAKEIKEANREVPRKDVEGVIRWHSRNILLVLPDSGSLDMVERSVSPLLTKAGGKIIGTETDSYNGKPAMRMDIGIVDVLNNEPLTMVTDRLFLVKESGNLPANTPKPQNQAGSGEMAIIIDDFGYNREPIAGFADMGRPITFSILPSRPYSNEAAARALSAGHLVMLHLPLEPLNSAEASEPITITVGMSDDEIKETTTKLLSSVPGIKGVNNHQGSRATADRRVMKAVLDVLKAQNLFFIDSRTTGKSVAAEVAGQQGVRTSENELFIDNSSDVEQIKKQLRKAVDMAHKNGRMIVIGHSRPNTVVAVREMIPEIEAGGIRLVYANQLLN
ncbi:divergent polysaccharide deacetylase family protein [Sporomusa acidovorans]|uniref:Divergent polysaccharide deacetylase n=1 Tax=Sporomusa acidovorans (strain ATCC 49682 / DSM 3132 / Mol) TaxID=1123286 RepID=A0ABZ3J1H6_SPOA4|nr:divergent polysaccharide deacetylase family protein [Sporomusa acidovorans]OZC13628.1 divergent polysaccharide deacetylase [Sporomusa acidovorans DSM 3132]SDE86483.1 hypothetical protein SAMN04488499_102443 [Sporomusa acidovorans]